MLPWLPGSILINLTQAHRLSMKLNLFFILRIWRTSWDSEASWLFTATCKNSRKKKQKKDRYNKTVYIMLQTHFIKLSRNKCARGINEWRNRQKNSKSNDKASGKYKWSEAVTWCLIATPQRVPIHPKPVYVLQAQNTATDQCCIILLLQAIKCSRSASNVLVCCKPTMFFSIRRQKSVH